MLRYVSERCFHSSIPSFPSARMPPVYLETSSRLSGLHRVSFQSSGCESKTSSHRSVRVRHHRDAGRKRSCGSVVAPCYCCEEPADIHHHGVPEYLQCDLHFRNTVCDCSTINSDDHSLSNAVRGCSSKQRNTFRCADRTRCIGQH